MKTKNSTKWSSLFSTELKFSCNIKSGFFDTIVSTVFYLTCLLLALFPWIDGPTTYAIVVVITIYLAYLGLHKVFNNIAYKTLTFEGSKALYGADKLDYEIGSLSRSIGIGLYLELIDENKKVVRELVFPNHTNNKSYRRLTRVIRYPEQYVHLESKS